MSEWRSARDDSAGASFSVCFTTIPRAKWIGYALIVVALGGASVRTRGFHRPHLGAHSRPRSALYHARAGVEHRGRFRGAARSRLHRVLRGGRLHVCAAGLAPLRRPSAVVGAASDGGGGGGFLRRGAGCADSAAARGLSRHRHPGLRRDHPYLSQQPQRAATTSPTARRA